MIESTDERRSENVRQVFTMDTPLALIGKWRKKRFVKPNYVSN